MRVHIGHVVAEVENERDVELLQKLITSAQLTSSNGGPELSHEPAEMKSRSAQPKDLGTFETAIAAWRERLRSEAQRSFVNQLASEARWFNDKELCTALGLKKIGQLSGVLCGLSRHAKAVKLKPEDVIQKRMMKTPEGEREHSYRLNPKSQQSLGRIKGENQMT